MGEGTVLDMDPTWSSQLICSDDAYSLQLEYQKQNVFSDFVCRFYIKCKVVEGNLNFYEETYTYFSAKWRPDTILYN